MISHTTHTNTHNTHTVKVLHIVLQYLILSGCKKIPVGVQARAHPRQVRPHRTPGQRVQDQTYPQKLAYVSKEQDSRSLGLSVLVAYLMKFFFVVLSCQLKRAIHVKHIKLSDSAWPKLSRRTTGLHITSPIIVFFYKDAFNVSMH